MHIDRTGEGDDEYTHLEKQDWLIIRSLLADHQQKERIEDDLQLKKKIENLIEMSTKGAT